MTAHSPATPLPWAQFKRDAGGFRITSGPLLANAARDAAYLAHAANAYPRLVEALRALVFEAGNRREWPETTKARALLRELGELP